MADIQKVSVTIGTMVSAELSLSVIKKLLLLQLQKVMKGRGISNYEPLWLDKYCHQYKMTADGRVEGEHKYEGVFSVKIGERSDKNEQTS